MKIPSIITPFNCDYSRHHHQHHHRRRNHHQHFAIDGAKYAMWLNPNLTQHNAPVTICLNKHLYTYLINEAEYVYAKLSFLMLLLSVASRVLTSRTFAISISLMFLSFSLSILYIYCFDDNFLITLISLWIYDVQLCCVALHSALRRWRVGGASRRCPKRRDCIFA